MKYLSFKTRLRKRIRTLVSPDSLNSISFTPNSYFNIQILAFFNAQWVFQVALKDIARV